MSLVSVLWYRFGGLAVLKVGYGSIIFLMGQRIVVGVLTVFVS